MAETLVNCAVVGGEKGYVWVKTDSHGGADLVKVPNKTVLQKIVSIPLEYGFAKVKKLPEWPVSPKEYWIENSHLQIIQDEPPSGEIVGKYVVELTIKKVA